MTESKVDYSMENDSLLKSSSIKNISNRIEYLKKHVKYIKNNPGLAWCFDYGIDALDKAFWDIKNAQDKNCSHVITSLQDSKSDLILQFNQIIKEKDMEIEKLNRIGQEDKDAEIQKLNQIIEVQRDKILEILKSWKDQEHQNNEAFKKLITNLEEKLEKLISDHSKCTEERSTQTGNQ